MQMTISLHGVLRL